MRSDTPFPEGIDLQKVRLLGSEYRNSSGLPLILVDNEGNEAWSLGTCPLRDKLSGSPAFERVCKGHRRKAVEESFRWGEPYISVCPFGLVTFSIPLLREGGLAAGLMSGFSIFPQMEKDIREEVLQSARRHRVGPLIGPKTRLRFRVVSSEILRKNASLLFELTGKHGVNDLPLINESREKTIQQVTIANFLEEARGRGQDLVSSLASLQHEIIDKVVLGDVNGSREIINRFLGVILLESGMNFTLLKVRLLELIIIISRAAIEKGISAEGLFGPRYAYLTDINAAASFDDLFWRVAKVLENFTRTVSEEMGRKRWAHTAKMRDYVEKHFASKVSARDMAAAAGVSVSRALHLFKREIGVPFTTYVAKRRIECAKYLLKNSALGIAAVASECGFYDQSHFSKTFSAREGVSPLRFRTQERGP